MFQCAICQEKFNLGGGLHRHLVKHSLKQCEYEKIYPESFNEYKLKSLEKRKQHSPMCIEFYYYKGLIGEDAEKAKENHIELKNKKVFENKYKNPRTYDYWLNLGYNKEEAKQILSKENIRDINFFVKKYGEEKGLEKFKSMHLKSGISNRAESAIPKIMKTKKCSLEEATLIYKENHTNGPKNIFYYTDRGFSEEEAIILRSESCIRDSPRRKEYWIYHYKLSDEEARIAVSKFQNKPTSNVSKVSIIVFSKLEKMLIDKYGTIDIRFGDRKSGTGEFSLYNKILDKMYYYDFTIFPLKVIIEYNGSCWHPNPVLLDTQEKKDKWTQLKTKKKYDEVLEKDLNKKNIAIQNNFKYYEIWDTDNINIKLDEIFKEITC